MSHVPADYETMRQTECCSVWDIAKLFIIQFSDIILSLVFLH